MKARLLATAVRTGHVATDFIHLVHTNQKPQKADTRPKAQAAHDVLDFYEDLDRPIQVDPVVPIKRLVRVLTEGLRGMPNLAGGDDGTMDGARLYRGCPVRLVGIPKRQFIIRDIYWDYEEVRIKEIGSEHTFYLVPWDCLEFIQERPK